MGKGIRRFCVGLGKEIRQWRVFLNFGKRNQTTERFWVGFGKGNQTIGRLVWVWQGESDNGVFALGLAKGNQTMGRF